MPTGKNLVPFKPGSGHKPVSRIHGALFGTRSLNVALLLAACGPLAAGSAFAATGTFNISGTSTTSQTLNADGHSGVITSTGSLTLGGGTAPITVTSSGTNSITNSGQIIQTGTGRGIVSTTGAGTLVITNNAGALIRTADADVLRITPASIVGATLNNYGSIISLNASQGGSQAVDWSNVTAGSNVINNYAGGLLKATEADAVRPGVNGVVNNAGTILSITTTGSSSDGIDMQNNSGAQITNTSTGLIEGGRHGITGGAADATVSFVANIANSGNIKGDNGSGINLDGFNSKQVVTISNSGSITGNGVTGDGDGIDVDGIVHITNTGTIRSINAFSAVAGSPAQSEGITVGGGTIVYSGLIEGDVAAGNTNAVGRGISLLGNDIVTGGREAIYGNAVVTNQSGGRIIGQSDSGIAVDGPASGFTVTINNNAGATIQGGGTANAAIRTGADNDTITNGGTINGASSGKAIDMGAGNNTLIIVGGTASVIGSINGGVGGTNTMTINPGAGNSFAYSGAISNFNTVEVQSGQVTLSGASTYTGTTMVSGGKLTLDGANRLSADSSLTLSGGTLELANAGSANGQTFSRFSLLDNSILELDSSSITFDGLGSVATGKSLTILDYVFASSPDYAFRFLGDFSMNADFLALLGETTIDGRAARFSFDGVYTDVTGVPEPRTFALLLAGLGLLGTGAYRRKQNATA